jgi:hypothetical protein
MYGIHNIFPLDDGNDNNPILLQRLIKRNGSWALVKDILRLTFNGDNKTVWLEEDKQNAILTILLS